MNHYLSCTIIIYMSVSCHPAPCECLEGRVHIWLIFGATSVPHNTEYSAYMGGPPSVFIDEYMNHVLFLFQIPLVVEDYINPW